MSEIIARFATLPSYGIGAVIVLLLYAVESEVRFGKQARTSRAGPIDRRSTLAVSACAAVPVLLFALAIRSTPTAASATASRWFRSAVLPGIPLTAWAGVVLGSCGLALRLWAVLQLRERYTKTLLVQHEQSVERGGPYRWVRHPGYLGSLLVLNGIALASGNWIALVASLIVTGLAYAYRIKVEDEMLTSALGEPYTAYRLEVRALMPTFRSAKR